MNKELIRQLTADEGCKKQVYKDSLGYDTIGIGRLVDVRKPGSGLRQSEIDLMLQNDIEDRVDALTARLPWFYLLDPVRQGVLLNMSFQLGTDGLLAFKNTLEMLRQGRWEAAAENMLLSKWASQTPERAKRLAKQIKTGVWVFQEGV